MATAPPRDVLPEAAEWWASRPSRGQPDETFREWWDACPAREQLQEEPEYVPAE